MKKIFLNSLFVAVLALFCNEMSAQTRSAQRRNTTVQEATTSGARQDLSAGRDTVIVPEQELPDSLPIPSVKMSQRTDDAIERNLVRERTPLAYEHIREDDAVYRQRLWRDIDTREKINLAFRYSANDDGGNQRFISIILKAIQDGPDQGGVTAFSSVDDRFTTPMTRAEVAQTIAGEPVSVPIFDEQGEISGYKTTMPEVNLDSFYKFRIKEEVIFDKESSRLVWRILGIAPLKNVITSAGVDMGETELFWVYYPDMRPIFAKYEVYNGKNYGARMSWEELFESRMFYGRIVKSTLDNPFDEYIKNQLGFKDNHILQLLEGENIKEKIFNYEQNLWSY